MLQAYTPVLLLLEVSYRSVNTVDKLILGNEGFQNFMLHANAPVFLLLEVTYRSMDTRD